MKAEHKLDAATERSKELGYAIEELQQRLIHDVRQIHALVTALATIHATTLGALSVELVRELVLSVSAAATAAHESAASLTTALRAR